MKPKFRILVVAIALAIDLSWLGLLLGWDLLAGGFDSGDKVKHALMDAWRWAHLPTYSIAEQMLFPATIDVHHWMPGPIRMVAFFMLCLAQTVLIVGLTSWVLHVWQKARHCQSKS